MKKRNLIWITLAASIGWSAASSAATIGTLDWDGTSGGFITNSADPTTQYLELSAAKQLNYAQTVTATNAGGVYENYHIASQTEAYVFYNAMHSGADIVDAAGNQSHYQNASNAFSDGALGGSYTSTNYDYAWFLSDITAGYAGYIGLYNHNNRLRIQEQWSTFARTDSYSDSGRNRTVSIGWLLVSDHNLTAVPVPAAVLMFAPALLSLVGLRRKFST